MTPVLEKSRPLTARRRALLVMASAILAVCGCLLAARSAAPDPIGVAGAGDAALYERVADRMTAGEGYYDALGAELQSGHYPMGSIFNWRTPLHLELVGRLPRAFSAGLLGALALLVIALAAAGLIIQGRYSLAVLQAALLCIPLATAVVRPGKYFGEIWAGALIAISVCAYRLGWRYCGVAAAVAALFFRELSLPYAIICAVLAIRERRRTEFGLYAAGFAAWACYFGFHTWAVVSRIPISGATLSTAVWIRFGGLPFLLNTSRMGLLLAFPIWVTAVYLPLALLGITVRMDAAWPRLAASVAFYLLAFSIAGTPENFYWGAMYSPLLALCAVWTAPAVRDLLRAVRQ